MRNNGYGGARARANGKLFEELVDLSCGWYLARGVAKIDKTPENYAITKRLPNGRFSGVIKQSQPDYKGVIRRGRCVCFECKYTDGATISKSRLLEHQQRYLGEMEALGAVVFILVSFGLGGFYRVPLADWVTFPTATMTERKLNRYRVPFIGGVVRFLDHIEVKQ